MSLSLSRIYAIILRSFYIDKRSTMRLTEVFYYPAIDIILWGLTTRWLNKGANHIGLLAIATSIVLWVTVTRVVYEISVGMIEEVWNRNMTNLFGTPIKLSEWMIGLMTCGMIKICVVLPYSALIAYFAYGVNIFSSGWMLCSYLALLIASGWSIGLLGASVILRFGRQAQSTPWMTAWFFAPLCAVYYPLESLPPALRSFAVITPLAHVFEAIRHQILIGTPSWYHIHMGIILAILWLGGAIFLFYYMFNQARQRGLASFE